MDYKENYLSWISDPYFDDDTKNELLAIKDDEKEIKERFYKNLDFGTGGLRGILGAGTNRLNIYTVRKATQGLANYILKQEGNVKEMGVSIAYDSRRFSDTFAISAALVLNGNGIKAYVFESLRPAPELSFSVRELGAISGIVITASHNPKEYNGYKVYWSDGGQVPYPRDEEIITEVNNVTDFKQIKTMDKEDAIKAGLFNIIGKEVDDKFVENVKKQSINPEIIKKMADDLSIVYTPIHGTGNIPVRRVLKEIGFNNVHVVKEQEMPDSEFRTVNYPNPEDPNAFKLALKLADSIGADIIVGTDPDCDRVGAVVKDNNGEYVILTGNMTGVLIADYIVTEKKKNGTLPSNAAIISTIVSTDMTKAITKTNNVDYYEVLTGFKYIGEKIKEFEETNNNTFIFGFEESYGCLAGTYARDKDAVVATMLICEIAAFYKDKGMTLYDGLQELYKKYGFYKESIESITLKGIEGLEAIKKIMQGIRTNPPVMVNGQKVIELRDYKTRKINNLITNITDDINMPVSDVLYYVLEDESWFCIRPSGTEPKIKVYFGTKAGSLGEVDVKLKSLIDSCMKIVNNYK